MFRIAHLTDIHVQPERNAAEGMVATFKHAGEQRPDLIVTGGDQVMDAFGFPEERVRELWGLYRSVLSDFSDIPIEHCIGNHDVWNWEDGKRWAMEELSLTNPYRSFDRGGWHIIILDSTHPADDGRGYTARLDEAQFEWLAQELASTPAQTPITIVSHIPILSAAAFLDGDFVIDGEWRVPGAWMHTDVARIKNLLFQHPNVKLCLSGHLHLVERLEYNGVTYICDGAVCGNWWKGTYQESPPGYGLIDLFPDGRFDWRYLSP